MQKWAGLVAVLAIASAAQAQFIFEQLEGEFEVTSETATDREYSVASLVVFEFGGLGLTSASAEATQVFMPVGTPDDFFGSITLYGASVADSLTLDFDGIITGIIGQPNASFAGEWFSGGATGAYAGLSGSGDFSGSAFFTSEAGGLMFSIFQGHLIPEPSAALLLAIGGALAIRSRRG